MLFCAAKPVRSLNKYLRHYYPRLFEWLLFNEPFLKYFEKTGVWKPSRVQAWRVNRARIKRGKGRLQRPVPALSRD